MGAAFDYEEPASVCTSRATPIPPKMVAARLLAVPLIPDHDVTGYVDAQADDEQALMDADLWNQVGSWRVVGYGSQWGKANPAPVSAGSSQRPLIPPSPARLLHPHLRRPRPPKDTMAHRRVRSMSRLSRHCCTALSGLVLCVGGGINVFFGLNELSAQKTGHESLGPVLHCCRWSAKARCALQVVRMDARAMCLRELPPDRAARTMLLRLELFLFRMPSWCQVRSQRRAFRYGDVPLSWSGV
ncbi:unnamed protein product [Effrenium voratum]|nr:unnamed protein product [Effrenium voratum]